MNRDLIEQYANGAEKLAQSIRGLTAEDIAAVPDADANVGKWTIQQVVIHVADCDMVFADRMKRVISEENPSLLAFDENKWAAALHYEDQSATDAAKLFELTRKQLATILRRLPESAFARSGMHNQAGKKTLADLVQGSVNHLEHHLKFIHLKRAKMGKEMW
jgi:uncharacterized damage-inducible protein DinB